MPGNLTSRSSWLVRYAAALAAVGAGLLVRVALTAWVGHGLPTYITFYPAVMVVALLAGLGPGLVATAFAALATDYWLLPPVGFGIAKPIDAVGLIFFSGMGLFMSLVAEYLRRAQQKAAAYDREQALRDTRRQNEFLASVLERASQPFAVRYLDGRLGLFNRAFAELTGYTAEELRSMDWPRTLTPPEWRELEEQKLDELHLIGQPVRYEKEYLRKDGRRVPVEVLIHLARDAEGKPEYYYSFLTDATERQRAEAALLQRERQFRTLADSIPNLAWWANSDGYITWYNRRWYEYTGTTPQQMEGWGWQSVHDPQILPTVLERWRASLATGQPFDMTFPLRGADGVFRPFLTRVMPLKDAQGRVQQWFGTNTDVSEKERAEEVMRDLNTRLQQHVAELQAANQQVQAARRAALNLMEDALRARKQTEQAGAELRAVAEQRRLALEAADLGAWDYHFQAGEVFWDERCREMWGIPQAEKTSYLGAIAAIHPEDRAGVDDAVKEALAGRDGGSYHREFRVVWPDGSVHWISSHGHVYFQGEGGERHPVRFIGANMETTAERQAQEALRESQDRLATFAAATFEGIVLSERGRIVDCNEQFAQMAGRTVQELKGSSIEQLLAPEDRQRVMDNIRTGRESVIEHQMLRRDGSRITVEAHGGPAHPSRRGLRHTAIRDVTERKLREEQLQKLNRTLKALRDSSQAMMRATSEAEYLEEVCRIVVEDCGHAMIWIGFAEDDEAKSVRPVACAGLEEGYLETLNITWADTERGRGPTGTAIRTGKPCGCADMLADPRVAPWREEALKRGYASSLVVPLLAEDRAFGAITIYARQPQAFAEAEARLLTQLADDVSFCISALRLRAAKALAELERHKFVSLADNSTEFIGMCDLDFIPFYVNEAGRRLVGLDSLAQACQTPVSEFFFPEDRKFILQEFLPRVLREGRAEAEIRFRHFKTGEALWMIYNVFQVKDADGKPVGFATVSRNITERKRAQEALQQTAADLKRSNRDLEQFAYVASHDLQEPLRAVGGYVKLLERHVSQNLDGRARGFIAGAFEGALRMEQLINDLLAFSRVGSRGGNFTPTNLDAALQQALANLHASLESAGARVTHDPLPTLAVDGTQLMQVFQNLIGNAVKFCGEQPPQIHVGARQQDGGWVFSVRDNGIGIDPQYFEKIFQLFQRLHTRKQYSGTGIGLAVCKRIVERHGGTIWVESQPGQGATFYFSIPEAASR